MGQGSGSEFVEKLFRMVEDPANFRYISWSADGRSFVIGSQEEFSEVVLERHFKHKNWSSFVRQLNKYDFYKIKNDAEKCMGSVWTPWEYKNRYFQRGRPDLLSKIRRKKAPSEMGGGEGSRPKQIESSIVYQSHVLSSIRSISKYLRAVVEDINELKRAIYCERQGVTARVNVLCVRESGSMPECFVEALRSPGYALTVVDGKCGIESVARWGYDVVVMYVVSVYHGVLVCRIRDADKDVPIILAVDEGFRDEYLGMGSSDAAEVFMAPFDAKSLAECISMHGRAGRLCKDSV
ncbi:HSF-type DNA-binding protein [Ordospora pajunii]|uniref:HSF-type DNA-binding protein n=1 Tax=Ordospora pajunii TaxID=3039483 RepID=UPI0029528B55|nr:HSF-type DNA-binding protein [Ordospora pajunii]KAH9411033.1 HSF-type DNA-binding protein [Ordospora pajunii]